MVGKFILAIGLNLAASVTYAGGNDCTAGSEFEPPLCRLTLPPIRQITIAENGMTSPADPGSAARCSRFALTTLQVRRYFAKARQANAADVHYTLNWSPCSASGRLDFKNGRTARWSITQSRIGSLTLDNGEEITLYCPTCKFKPFQ
jgi:hypothetical protein